MDREIPEKKYYNTPTPTLITTDHSYSVLAPLLASDLCTYHTVGYDRFACSRRFMLTCSHHTILAVIGSGWLVFFLDPLLLPLHTNVLFSHLRVSYSTYLVLLRVLSVLSFPLIFTFAKAASHTFSHPKRSPPNTLSPLLLISLRSPCVISNTYHSKTVPCS